MLGSWHGMGGIVGLPYGIGGFGIFYGLVVSGFLCLLIL